MKYKYTEDELILKLDELESETQQLCLERDDIQDRIWDNQEKMEKIEKRLERNQFKKTPDVLDSHWEKVGFDFK